MESTIWSCFWSGLAKRFLVKRAQWNGGPFRLASRPTNRDVRMIGRQSLSISVPNFAVRLVVNDATLPD
jgi:hypothetical protein